MSRKKQSRISGWVRVLLLVPLPLIALFVYLAGQTPREGLFDAQASAVSTDVRLPLPVHLPQSGFTLVDTIQVYDESNLYEKINGHDGAFFRFGFVALTFASYSPDGAAFVDVYAYRMNRRENALGIFAGERSENWDNLPIRDAGYRAGGAMFFYRGPWYVQITPSELTPLTQQATTEIADSLLAILPESPEPLSQLDWFPTKDLVANSYGFFPGSAFGTDFIGEVFTAEYQAEGATMRAFCHESDSAASAFTRFLAFLDKAASPVGTLDHGGVPVERFDAYGEEAWVSLVGNRFFGLEGVTDTAFARQICGALITSATRTEVP